MLTKKLKYKISGTFVQDLIIRQMQNASYFSKLWREAMEEGDDVRDELYCRMMNFEQAKIWSLLEVQGFKQDDPEFLMVSEYIADAIIALMK